MKTVNTSVATKILIAAGVDRDEAADTLETYVLNAGLLPELGDFDTVQEELEAGKKAWGDLQLAEEFVYGIIADLRENHNLPAADAPRPSFSIWDNKDHGYAKRDVTAEAARSALESFAETDNEDGADEYGSLALYRDGKIVATGAASDLRFKV